MRRRETRAKVFWEAYISPTKALGHAYWPACPWLCAACILDYWKLLRLGQLITILAKLSRLHC